MSKILHRLVMFQTQIRLYHWSTRSYSRHVASGNLYTSIDKLIDNFIESLQGILPAQRVKYNTINFTLYNISDDIVGDLLEDFSNFLTSDIDQFLDSLNINNGGKQTSDLKNIRDEILGLIHQSQYLFTFK